LSTHFTEDEAVASPEAENIVRERSSGAKG
jgi:hypothetical protein